MICEIGGVNALTQCCSVKNVMLEECPRDSQKIVEVNRINGAMLEELCAFLICISDLY